MTLLSEPKTLHFMAGLPRSGSTMLISLLSQNPRIFGAPISGLYGILNGVYANWQKVEFHQELPNEAAKRSTLKAIIEHYHDAADKPIILDKNRHWTHYIALIEELLGRQMKIIVPVRPIPEILASFEYLSKKNPLIYTMADEHLGEVASLATRCEYFMGPQGAVGSAGTYLKDALTSGYADRMLFVDYNKFMRDPKAGLDRIYAFLGEATFEHDFGNIPMLSNPGERNDRVFRYPGLHQVRPVLERKSPSPIEVLGAELVMKYSGHEFWEPWI